MPWRPPHDPIGCGYLRSAGSRLSAVMMVTGTWKGAGVWNMKQLDPDPFMTDVAARGLPWQVEER